jgi:hypothetical protein
MLLCYMRRCVACITIFFAIAGLSGCAATDAYTFADFVNDLRQAGATVEVPPNSTVDHGFPIPGRRIAASGADIYVYEFSNGLEAMKAASTVSPSGYSITRTDGITTMMRQVDWREPPHFYRRDQLIVIYAGRDAGLKSLLATLLSPPFAGSETDYRGQ